MTIAQQMNSLQFYESIKECYRKAANSVGELRYDFAIGNTTLQINFAGPALYSRLTNSLKHLEQAKLQLPKISILAWDSFSTGISMPPAPWKHQDYGSHGIVEAYSDDRIQTVFHTDANALSLVDQKFNEGIYWIPNPKVAYYEEASPFRTILHLLCEKFGYVFLHSAVVASDNLSVLLVGKSGSGKSTTALSSLESNLKFLSDDYCFVKINPRPEVYSLYSAAKSTWNTINRLPFLEQLLSSYSTKADEKAVYQIYNFRPEKLINQAEIKAMIIPVISNSAETTFSKASSKEALLAAAPSTIFQLPYGNKQIFEAIGKIVNSVPSYHMQLSSDYREINNSLEKFIKSI